MTVSSPPWRMPVGKSDTGVAEVEADGIGAGEDDPIGEGDGEPVAAASSNVPAVASMICKVGAGSAT